MDWNSNIGNEGSFFGQFIGLFSVLGHYIPKQEAASADAPGGHASRLVLLHYVHRLGGRPCSGPTAGGAQTRADSLLTSLAGQAPSDRFCRKCTVTSSLSQGSCRYQCKTVLILNTTASPQEHPAQTIDPATYMDIMIKGASGLSHEPAASVVRPKLGQGWPASTHRWSETACWAASLACSNWTRSEERDWSNEQVWTGLKATVEMQGGPGQAVNYPRC